MSDVAAETPLTELCVVDFTHLIAGPLLCRVLGYDGEHLVQLAQAGAFGNRGDGERA